jgi:hypothetical protein
VVLVLLPAPLQVHAQDPSPTPTATPAYLHEVELSEGSTLLLVRSVTYGEIAVVLAVLVLSLLFIGYLFLRIPKLWR